MRIPSLFSVSLYLHRYHRTPIRTHHHCNQTITTTAIVFFKFLDFLHFQPNTTFFEGPKTKLNPTAMDVNGDDDDDWW
ncbi:hypothetical protein LXL04_009409 [Taraxacum kok-saghyz]